MGWYESYDFAVYDTMTLTKKLYRCEYSTKIVPWQGAQLYDLKNGAEFSSDVFYALPRPSPLWPELPDFIQNLYSVNKIRKTQN